MATRKGNGVGKGDGWGGPAKGAGRKSEVKQFTRQTASTVARARWQPPPEDGLSRAQIKSLRTIELENMLYGLAAGAEREETRVTAAVKLHAIYNGTPVARNINLNTDDISALSDDELRAELERLGGEAASADAGDASPGVPPKPSGVLH